MKEHRSRIETEQVRITYGQTMTGVIGNLAVGVVFLSIFWDVANHSTLLAWYACLFALGAIRIVPFVLFLRRRPDEDNIQPWGSLFITLLFLQGSMWGVAFLIFIPVEDPIYNVIVGTWMVGLVGATASAYSAHIKTMLAFFIPVMLPGTIHLFFIGGKLNTAVAIAISLYAIVVLRALFPINRSMIDAIRLNFELGDEIEERKKIEEKLREMSLTDALTGLSNRRHFDEALDRELRRAKRDSYPLSLILFDIDSFKGFNDTYGHLAGDACLQVISSSLKKAINRPGDLVARYGGEELAVILPNTDSANAFKLAESIRNDVEALIIPHNASEVAGFDMVTISAGVATTDPNKPSTPSDVIKHADDALYKAKSDGRNRVVMG